MTDSNRVIIGSNNLLTVSRMTPQGAYMDGGDEGDILLPNRYVPADCAVGQELSVFVFFDSEDRLTATTLKPAAEVGEVAWLKIADVNDAGAFLDWGLPKDLLLPWNEISRHQKVQIEPGRHVLVMLFQDSDGRIAASTRLDEFLKAEAGGFNEGDSVDVIIGDRSELGMRVVVNHRYWGLVHESEIFRPLKKGEKLTGWIKTLRADRKLNIALTAPGPARLDGPSQDILNRLQKEGGFMAVSDKSPPEAIYKLFGVSKKVFKQAIGTLYKQRLIVIETGGIRIVKS